MKTDNTPELSQAELLIKFIEQDSSCAEVLKLTQEGKQNSNSPR